jgi:predicted O-methyltransferase YrrM
MLDAWKSYMLPNLIRRSARRVLGVDDEFVHLRNALIELDNIEELKKVFGWKLEPVLDDSSIYEFESIQDINLRRVRDAECIGTIVRNTNPSVCLDIGTGKGNSAALMAVNAPQARVFTVNIPPEEIHSGEGGVLTTAAYEREEIGSYYLGRNLANLEQLLANTATWEPNIGTIDLALVDGCHDTQFVCSDSQKTLRCMKPGSFLLWHDFNLDLVAKKDWIHEVCMGVEKLLRSGLIAPQVFHVRNSWVGVYRVM